jgi:hypothetical protein
MKPALGFVITSALAFGGACDAEQLVVLVPRVSLCPAADAPEASCGFDVDVGPIAVGVPHAAAVFIVNRGTGALLVRGASASLDEVTVGTVPERVAVGSAEPLPLTIALDPLDDGGALGSGIAAISVLSSDVATPTATVNVTWEGIPPPRGEALLCDAARPAAPCAADIEVDFGVVRPTQSASRLVLVRNGGDGDLAIEDLRVDGDDFALASSSRRAILAPGDEGDIVVVFSGSSPGRREANLVVLSDDPASPQATAHLAVTISDNLAPTAVAVESLSGAATAVAFVDALVGIDGTGSSDPEDDPLAFTWTLAPPAGSAVVLADANAQSVLFVPDVRGAYAITLVVADAIAQASAPATVVVDVIARFKARARVQWSTGGDVDLHVIEGGSAPFSESDCRFDNRIVGDAELLDDDTASPGLEQAVLAAAPLAGTWEVWVQLFDDIGLGPVAVEVDIVVDDEEPAALGVSNELPATCAMWHAADVTVGADGSVGVVDVSAAVTTLCPP